MTMKLHTDFEVKSELNLREVGLYRYAMHPSTDIICIDSALDDGPVVNYTAQEVKDKGWKIPNSAILGAHNAPFEAAIYYYVLYKRYGYPLDDMDDPERYDCTMARALMCGFPPALEFVAEALGLPHKKDLDGKAAMLKLAKPLRYDPLGEAVWCEEPELYRKTYSYCGQDVEVERSLDKSLPALPRFEKDIWNTDFRINRRGIQVDLKLAQKARDLALRLTSGLNAQLSAMTGGYIDKATQVATMKKYLAQAHGVVVDSLDKEAVTDLLADPKVPQLAKDVVSIRRQVGKSSTAKYEAALLTACPDGRVRGAFQYYGGHTGRWSGRLLQLQNIPQGYATAEEQAVAIRDIMTLSAEEFMLLHGDQAMDVLSKCIRGVLVAAPGKRLLSRDLNAVEARGLFWLAGDEGALGSYARGDSPYLDMANYIYNRKDVTKKGAPVEYDIGKRTVLGCGYQMGAPRFQATVKTQANLEISMALAERAVSAYREKYPLVKALWKNMEQAAVAAVKNATRIGTPNTTATYRVGSKYATVLWGMSRDRRFLVCKLPSGRHLWYFKPHLRMVETRWGEGEQLFYWAQDAETKQWAAHATYGGLLTENAVQAIARDILAVGMQECEAGEFPIVLHAHDELLAEVEDLDEMSEAGYGYDQLGNDLEARMLKLQPWATGYPVKAEGWMGERYRK